jgi:mannosyl-3-phosphoglycerate phosphatase
LRTVALSYSVSNRDDTRRLLVLTDLDGTLLDPLTYSYDAAIPALAELKQREIPVVLVSSKTRVELEPIRYQLGNQEPFVAENGGAVFVPKGFFSFPLEGAVLRGPYQVLELGTSYAKLRSALTEISHALGYELKGFGDMSVEEIMTRTGLSHAEALLSKQREYDEPFVVLGLGRDPRAEQTHRLVRQQAEARGLRCVSGGQFHHLLGTHDKGQACRSLINWYRLRYGPNDKLETIGLGDSENDLPLLAEVDHAILIQKADGSYDPYARLPNLVRAPGIGPVGWNHEVLALCRTG